MIFHKTLLTLGILGLSGCVAAPVNTSLISTAPASEANFTVAQQAVKACKNVINRSQVLNNFRKFGFGVSEQLVSGQSNRSYTRAIITPPTDAVSVLFHPSRCYVGLKGMTPSQSVRLAQIWVDAYNARPNSDFGDGLSHHVSGAWRRFVDEPARIPDKAAYKHRIYIAAYKTWPTGPYDPQKNLPFEVDSAFPNAAGAAVSLRHGTDCISYIKTGPRSGVFLACSEPDFKPL